MCIITMLDVNNNILSTKDIKTLTISNALLGNMDGFGYYLFNNKHSKSKDNAILFWRKHFEDFTNNNFENINGIYHVRKSSTNYTVKDDYLADDKSHPFNYNDIIVAHNGFLTYRYTHINADKFEKFILGGNLIDSQKFSIILSKICEKGKVTFDNIKEALNLFSGPYALAIKGKLDDFVWLVRGKERTLFDMNIYSGKNIVGKLVNTSTFSQMLVGENLLDYGYEYDIKELKENTAYKYNIGSFILEEVGEIKQDSTYIAKPTIVKSVYNEHNLAEKSIYEDVLVLMYKMNLLITDLLILSEIAFDKPLFLLDNDEFNVFKTLLDNLFTEYSHDGRIQLWNEIKKERGDSVYKLYMDTNMEYPFFMNSKFELKDILKKCKREKDAHELSTLQ